MTSLANSRILIFSVVCAIYCAVCFLFKNFVLDFVSNGKKLINPIFDFYYTKNTGAAFSFLEGKTILLCIITGIIVIGLFVYFKHNINKFSTFDLNGFCFLFAGVFSNFMERICDGFVTDYFRLLFISFPIFNLADIFINIGAIILISSLIISKRSVRG